MFLLHNKKDTIFLKALLWHVNIFKLEQYGYGTKGPLSQSFVRKSIQDKLAFDLY